ncbi:aminopeptidase [Alsobacter metallidurans]|uniref:Aminopeptidase n=1 Tax=Alsobacter metallidurans TaxID=340221 RepID=A0A917I4C2_9HYPH|nr:leucyl aminopeptidase family protein [Alsobacter metallidurans]GGH08594.1 aminopeptidase [Alsobacter metallidurans]
MIEVLPSSTADKAVPILLVTSATWRDAAVGFGAQAAAFAQASGYTGAAGSALALPGHDGALAAVLFGDDAGAARRDPFHMGKLAAALPPGLFRLPAGTSELACLALRLGSYRFGRYRQTTPPTARVIAPDGVDAVEVDRIAGAVAAGRDLINTPANDLGPEELEQAVRTLAGRHRAGVKVVTGDDLLAQGFPMVHAVGRASSRAPRLIDMTWGESFNPKVTLVGKGVCFDTGGLNIKPDASMLLMKKDMGGAATALAIAQMVMEARLKLRLRVIIPAVENSISGSAFRPGDVLRSRKGLTVEIGNTDAEGRLILADALALADEEEPELLFDFATLTGAARVALGPELPPFYTDDDAMAAEVAQAGDRVNDPVWRLPLWKPYRSMLDSKIADINHIGGSFAGSVTAALFLRSFVEKTAAHAHFDIYGWVPSAKPGRPEGGEPQAARLVYDMLKHRYGSSA